jgi:hypothetical protein
MPHCTEAVLAVRCYCIVPCCASPRRLARPVWRLPLPKGTPAALSPPIGPLETPRRHTGAWPVSGLADPKPETIFDATRTSHSLAPFSRLTLPVRSFHSSSTYTRDLSDHHAGLQRNSFDTFVFLMRV